jgi:hypothetical protein
LRVLPARTTGFNLKARAVRAVSVRAPMLRRCAGRRVRVWEVRTLLEARVCVGRHGLPRGWKTRVAACLAEHQHLSLPQTRHQLLPIGPLASPHLRQRWR